MLQVAKEISPGVVGLHIYLLKETRGGVVMSQEEKSHINMQIAVGYKPSEPMHKVAALVAKQQMAH